jgi:hypothetical protein
MWLRSSHFKSQNKNVEGAGDDLLSALEQTARRKPNGEAWSILSFATRCLEFIVPSPKICRELTVLTLDMVCRDHTAAAANVKRVELDPREAVIALVGAARENQRSIRETFEAVITERINSADSNAALLAAEVALHLNVCLHIPRASSKRADNFWQQFSERIRERCWPRLKALAHDNLLIALDGFWHGKLSIQVLLEWFGTAAIFTRRMFRAFAPIVHSSPAAEWIVVNLLNPERKRPEWNPDTTLRSIGKWFLTASLPWAKREAVGSQHHFMPYLRFRPGLRRVRFQTDSDQTFAIFGILAVALEAVGERGKDLIKEVEAVKLPLLTQICALLTARLSNMATLPGFSIDSKLGLNDKQSEFVRRWVDRDFDLIG